MEEYIEEMESEDYSSYEDEILEAKKEKRRRKRERKRLIKKAICIFLLVTVVLGTALIAFANSGYFTVNKIKVTGNEYYTNAQIKKICDAEKNVNIWKIDKKAMVALLLDDPYIQEATIKRDLPDRIIISVVERKECCAVYSNKNYYVIDSNGYVLSVSGSKPEEVPVLKGFEVKNAKEKEAIEVKTEKSFKAVLSMLEASMDTTISYRRIKVKNQVCYAYVKKKLYIRGLPSDIEEVTESGKLEAVLYDVYERGVNHGCVIVGNDGYCVFSP